MFQALAQLLSSSSHVDLLVSGNGDEMTVTVIPKITDAQAAALKTPLSLTGTPAELDEGFAQALTTYATARKSLAEQVAQTAAILDAAKKQEAAKAVKNVSKVAKPVAVGIDELSEEEGEFGSESESSCASSPASSKPEPEEKAQGAGEFDLATLL